MTWKYNKKQCWECTVVYVFFIIITKYSPLKMAILMFASEVLCLLEAAAIRDFKK